MRNFKITILLVLVYAAAALVSRSDTAIAQTRGGGYLGAIIMTLTPDGAAKLHVRATSGAVILSFASNSPAAQAGLKAFDVIVAIDGQNVASLEDVLRIVGSHNPGETVNIQLAGAENANTVSFAGKVRKTDPADAAAGRTVAVVLAARPAAPANPPAPVAQSAPLPQGDAALLLAILQARGDSFATLKGNPRANDSSGDSVWQGTARPFNLHCQVVWGPVAQAYYCSNVSPQAAQDASNPLADALTDPLGVMPSQHQTTGLSEDAAANLSQSIKAAFQSVIPGLSWTAGGNPGAPEAREALGGTSPGQYLVSVGFTTFDEDGDPDDGQIYFYV
jgi:membrane-associated protease RseP (regulator of RpoE activity)